MTTDEAPNRILMPIAATADQTDMLKALLLLMRFQTPRITLFHVIEAPVEVPLDADSKDEIVERAKKDKTKPIAERLISNGYQVETKIAVARSTADAIIEEAHSCEYTFVFIMKRRKRKGAKRLMSESVTDKVIRTVECPVVIVLV